MASNVQVAGLYARVTLDHTRAVRGLTDLRGRLVQTTGWFKTLRDQANITGAGLKGGLLKGVESAMGGLSALGKSFDTTKALLGSALLAPLSLVGKSAIEMVATYEKEMNVFQLVTKASTTEMGLASAAIKHLANDTSLAQFSRGDAAAALLAIAQSGRSATDSISMLRPALLLAAAGEVAASEGATILANAMNVFKLPASEAGQVADLLAGTMKYAGTTLGELYQGLQIAGPVFKQAGVPIQDMMVLFGELGRQGIKGSEAGTALRSVIQGLITPSEDANAMLKAMGVHVYNARGEMRPFRDIIGELAKGLEPLTEAQRNQRLETIFGKEAMGAAAIIFGKDAVSAFDALKAEVAAAGLAQEIADAKTKGLEGSTKALAAAASNAAFDAVAPFKESIKGLTDEATKLLKGFSDLDPQTQKIIGGLLLGAAAAAPLGLAILGLKFAVEGLLIPLRLIPFALTLISAHPIAAALIGLGAALIYAYQNSETFRNITDGAFDAVKRAAQAMWDIVKPILEPLGDMFGGILRGIGLLPGALPPGAPAAAPPPPKRDIYGPPQVGPGEELVGGPNAQGQYEFKKTSADGRSVSYAWRDQGGPGEAGRGYAIGVPEIFVPNTGGNFIPLGGAKAGGVNVNFYGPVYGFQDFEDHVVLATKTAAQKGRL